MENWLKLSLNYHQIPFLSVPLINRDIQFFHVVIGSFFMDSDWFILDEFHLQVLIPKLKDPDPNPSVTISVLAAIGEQAQVIWCFSFTPKLCTYYCFFPEGGRRFIWILRPTRGFLDSTFWLKDRELDPTFYKLSNSLGLARCSPSWGKH